MMHGRIGAAALLLVALGYGATQAAPPSFEIDLKDLDAGRKKRSMAPATKKSAPAPKPVTPTSPVTADPGTGQLTYRVRPGDHIFKILMRDFRLSNAEAERLIPEIVAMNRVRDLRRLTVGQQLLLPAWLASRVVPPPTTAALPAASPAPPLSEPVAETTEGTAASEVPAALPVLAPESAAAPAEPVMAPFVAPPAPSSPATPAPPAMVPVGTVQAVTINGADPVDLFLRLAEVLQIKAQTHQVITSQSGTAQSYSIKVPVYGEGGGRRLVVSAGMADPYQYTLFRLLAAEGYGVLQFRESDGFREVTAATLAGLGLRGSYGRFRLVNGQEQEVLGFLLRQPGGSLLLTNTPVAGTWTALEVGGE